MSETSSNRSQVLENYVETISLTSQTEELPRSPDIHASMFEFSTKIEFPTEGEWEAYVCKPCDVLLQPKDDYKELPNNMVEYENFCPCCHEEKPLVIHGDSAEFDTFAAELEYAKESLKSDAATLERINMADWVLNFTDALEKDHIQPDDF